MIPLEEVQIVLTPHGYVAEYASGEIFSVFENDLDEADKYELGRTRHQDWRKELFATLNSSGSTFNISTSIHGGALIFGVTPFPDRSGRMWMLQSKSFAAEAASIYGRGLPHKMGSLTHAMIELFLKHYSPLFNFIPRDQTRNIRWLQQGGFQFFHRTDIKTDIVFFGQGEGVEALASNQQLWTACLGAELFDGTTR